MPSPMVRPLEGSDASPSNAATDVLVGSDGRVTNSPMFGTREPSRAP